MGIIVPQGKTVKRIVIEIDGRGQCTINAADLSGPQPFPLPLPEVLVWLTELVAATLKGMFTQKQKPKGIVDNGEQKTK